MKIAGSGSIGQRHGSADPDPDPHQNVPEHCLKLQVQAVNGEEPTQNGEDSEAARKKNNKRKRRNADDKLEEISKFMHYMIT